MLNNYSPIKSIRLPSKFHAILSSLTQNSSNLRTCRRLLGRKSFINYSVSSVEPHFFEAFSLYNQLKRVTTYCLRFTYNTRKNEKRGGHLTTEELNTAEITILKVIQEEQFYLEIICLRKGKPLNKPLSKIARLNASISKDGLFRVGGRIQGSILDYDAKHPILLSQRHHMTDLIIRHAQTVQTRRN